MIFPELIENAKSGSGQVISAPNDNAAVVTATLAHSSVRPIGRSKMASIAVDCAITPIHASTWKPPQLINVCFTPESGHVQCSSPRLLWSNSGKRRGSLCRALIDGTQLDSTESPSRHWHYLHHLHCSLWHGQMRIVGKEGCSRLVRFCLYD